MMKIDSIGRAVALQLAAGRLAVGAGTSFATARSLRALGFDETGAAGTALARVLGARDLALGSLAVAGREDRAALHSATLAAAALDAADAAAFLVAMRDPATRRAGIRGVLFAGGAAAAGFWAARRLR
jgi:hypothetical protein